MHACSVTRLRPTLFWPRGLEPTRLLCPWDSPGKNTGVGCHLLLQVIFPTQGSSPGLTHYRQIVYHLSHLGSQIRTLHPQSLIAGLYNRPVPNRKRSTSRLCILSPWLFNLYAEYIMRNAGLEEAQAGIKIAGRNINNLRYADDTTLMAESEEVIDISPGNLDSSLCFFQPSISHDVLCIQVK